MRPLCATPALLALLLGPLGGCGFDQILVINANDDDTSALDTGAGDDTGGAVSASGLRAPSVGEIVLSELMIDPAAVDDSVGEWIEVWSAADEAVSLEGCALGDRDVDDAPLEPTSPGSLDIEPGAFAVLCSHTVRAENGGVECDGSYTYNTWGDGFSLANGGDEVQLRDPSDQVIDEVTYVESPSGASSGLSPSAMDASQNDSAGLWCAQRSGLSGGDAGTPRVENDPC